MADSTQRALPEHQGRAMELEMRTSASPEQIWNAWADPEKISQWFADAAEGWAHKGAQVTWIFDEFGYRIPYQVVESIPGECVILGGHIPGRIPFLLEVTIERAAGDTVVRLVNSGFLEGSSFDEEYEGVVSGWGLALAMLKYYAEQHYGVAKQQFLLTREAEFDLARLPEWYTHTDRLNEWLTNSASVGEEGAACVLELKGGPRIDGTVAAISRREASYIWPSQNVMIELKGWAAGPKKLLATRVTGWNSPVVETLRPVFTSALDRLALLAGAARRP